MSKVLALLLIVCVAGVAFWFGKTSGAPPVEAPKQANEAGAETEVPKTAESGVPQTEGRREVETKVEAPPVGVSRVDGTQERVTIRVVDAGTGRAVPGAEVLGAIDRSRVDMTEDDRRRYRALKGDLAQLFEVFGVRFIADAKGEVQIEQPTPSVDGIPGFAVSPQNTWVARLDGRYGEGQIKEIEKGVLEIELEADLTAHVLILDVEGQPAAGAEVELRAMAKDVALSSERAWRFTSDSAGRVKLSHMQRRVVSASQDAKLGVCVPGVEIAPVILDVTAPPAEPIVFQLPATGAISVRVFGAGGEPLDVEGHVDLLFGAKNVAVAKLNKGIVRFPYVGLGFDYELRLYAGRAEAGSTHLRGPVQTGKEVVYDFDLGDRVLLSGSVIDPRGLPVTATAFDMALVFGSETAVRTVPTDEAGRFAFLVKAGAVARQLKAVRVETNKHVRNAQAGMRAQKDLGEPFEGRIDLGSFRLEDLPLLARGRVIDAAGKAIDSPFLVARSGTTEDAQALSVRKLVGGQFEVRGESSSEVIELKLLTARGPVISTCNSGALDLVIQMAAESKLTAQILHDGDASVRVDVALIPEAGGKALHASNLFPEKTRLGTRVSWRNVEPGRYQLVGRVIGMELPFVTLKGIDVRAGSTPDSRLESLSLAGFTALELVFVNSDWNPVEAQLAGVAFVRRSPKHWEGVRIFSKKSRPVLTVENGGVDLHVCMEGYSPISVFGAKGKTLVRLVKEELIDVPFVFGSGGGKLSVRAIPVSVDGARYSWSTGEADDLDSHGVARWANAVSGKLTNLRVPGAGRYELTVRRWNKAGAYDLIQPKPKSFVLPPGGLSSPIVVSF